jgi:NADH-quinone oxidoreductase subunit J
MSLAQFYFYAFALIAVLCGTGVVTVRHPITAAVALVGVMLSLSGIYGLLGGPFLAIVQILVYAGAIMMLVVFVIMVLNSGTDDAVPSPSSSSWALALIPLIMVVLLSITFSRIDLAVPEGAQAITIEQIAARLFDTSGSGGGYYVLFEVIGLALLVALTGAVLLAKRRLDDDPAPAKDAEGSSHG